MCGKIAITSVNWLENGVVIPTKYRNCEACRQSCDNIGETCEKGIYQYEVFVANLIEMKKAPNEAAQMLPFSS